MHAHRGFVVDGGLARLSSLLNPEWGERPKSGGGVALQGQ